MGVTKLAGQLGLDLSDAKDLFAKYHAEVPFVKEMSEFASNRAAKKGSIRTLLGRKYRYDKWEPALFGVHKAMSHKEAFETYGNGIRRAFTYKALNALIQGSAADQTKMAMVMLAEEGMLPLVQIHDELAMTVPDEATARRIQEIMENCVTLQVPSVVDAEIGPSWGTATKSPKEGDVVVFARGRSREAGHVGFYVGEEVVDGVRYILVLGGNQRKAVNVAYYPARYVLGYRTIG